jgi:hypothetical protein
MSSDDDKAKAKEAFARVRAAIAKLNAGQPYDEVCVCCGRPLEIMGLPPGGPFTQWLIHCPCGKSAGKFFGL